MLRLILLALFAIACTSASAQTGKSPWEDYGNRIKASQKVSPLGNNAFGDQVSLSNGELSFAVTDVSIPGNSDLPVAFSRTYTVKNWRHRVTDAPLADWDLDVPMISGVYATEWVGGDGSANRCSVSGPPPSPKVGVHAWDFWQGAKLNLPGLGGGELLSTLAGAPAPAPSG